jgi:hypothetical protein
MRAAIGTRPTFLLGRDVDTTRGRHRISRSHLGVLRRLAPGGVQRAMILSLWVVIGIVVIRDGAIGDQQRA